jgi:gamma-glutamylcyclotransferase (GGCT)/AIG2-like uncharacterized protein YtfP
MKKGDLLFVYGTLRPGQHADLSKSFEADYIGKDSVVGKLYHLGGYPGLKIEGSDLVHGDVFRIRTANLVARLDMYEGYPTLYSRQVVESSNGKSVWVYVYNSPCIGKAEVPGGDWCKRIEISAYTS